MLLGTGACSDDSATNPTADKGPTLDKGHGDGGTPSDGSGFDTTLWACEEVGKPCNAHDACALNPICGPDKLCRPQSYQNCDDGLDCTEDICKSLGQCENLPKAGTCALRVISAVGTEIRCFKKDDLKPDDPCQICDPENNALKWSDKNGGSCDDGDLCTKDDYCQAGVCKGTDYRQDCTDAISCTEDVCDGKGGCGTPKLKADWCLIGGECFKDQVKDSTGCNICDAKTSQSAWTAVSLHCRIGGKCYLPGEKDPTGCAECDPNVNDKDWTPLTGKCTIGGKCYALGDKHPTATCGECDPVANPNGWTVKTSNQCLISDTCYNTADLDSTQCAECDPTADKYAWTPLTGKCKIDGKCYNSGDKYPAGCAECDPAVNATGWTVKTTNECLIAGVCKKAGDLDPTQCSQCEPVNDKYGWTAVAGKCKIDGKCYSAGDKYPAGCAECDPAVNATGWTVKTTTDCLIAGVCKKAGDLDATQCSQCDPLTDKYGWSVVAGKCKIDGKCYSAGDKYSAGCAECDPAINASGWTVKTSTDCLIDGLCKKTGDLDAIQCGQCDPATDKYGWTPVMGKCKIAGQCYLDQAKDVTGCLMCDVATNTTAWTPVTGATATTFDFEGSTSLPAGITQTSSQVGCHWHVSKVRVGSGANSLRYANPATNDYDCDDGLGGGNNGTATISGIKVPAGKKAGMRFSIYLDIESGLAFDPFEVRVKGSTTPLWVKPTSLSDYQKWLEVTIDLSAEAGKTIDIEFFFDTADDYLNSSEGIFIDDITIYTGC